MEKTPEISVIMPVFNVEKYVEASIQSALAQTFKDFELIVIDDCSTDRSAEIVENMISSTQGGGEKNSQPFIRFIRHERNRGQGIVRNTGMTYARGKYIAFLDSDDLLMPGALDMLYRAAESTNVDVVHSKGNFEQFENNDGVFSSTLRLSNEPGKHIGMLSFDKNVRLFECRVQELMFSSAWLNFYRRDFLERHQLKFPGILSEDEAWTTVICCFADRLFCINEPFYIYRKRHGSTMTQINHERAKEGLRSILEGIRYLDQMFARVPTVSPEIKNGCIQSFTNRLMTNFVLRCYQPNELSGDDLIKYFVQALRPRFAEDSELIAYFLQGLAMQNAWRMNLQIQLINLTAGRPAQT